MFFLCNQVSTIYASSCSFISVLLQWIMFVDVDVVHITPSHCYYHFIDIILSISLFYYCWFIIAVVFEFHHNLHGFY